MGNKAEIQHWKEGAEESFQVAKDMKRLRHYHWALFHYQLGLEKLLKAVIVTKAKEIPLSHDLTKLAKQAKLPLTEERVERLDEITTFNLEARYDDYKKSFYKKATKSFTQKWERIAKELYKWIEREIK